MTEEDLAYWSLFISSIKPLKQKKGVERVKPILKERLKIKPKQEKEVSYILDLHGLTLQDAYTTVLRFIALHFALSSKSVLIITGKGLKGEGKIKNEILFWLETDKFKEKISRYEVENQGGAIRLYLKKEKGIKKCQRKK
ncbi:MAG: Smr/MutS family protein [Alphaproteobacteria bacterium]|nr:Smr/MutS family protein [Alphaproteobacteria bacterium]